ncbi:MAG: DUF6702 family protein [Rhodothermales bacterium]|nr:DUF6702 family protein [Rhodothermales bacterium]
MLHRIVPLVLTLLAGCLLMASRLVAPHEFHVSYARLAVEGPMGMMQIRLFKDDLEAGLQNRFGISDLTMRADPEVDSLFGVYLNEKLVLSAGGIPVPGVIVSSGEELQNGIPVWWYTLSYEAPEAFAAIHIQHDVLMEVFSDQKNVFRVKHFPSEKEWSLYFVPGDSDFELTLE